MSTAGSAPAPTRHSPAPPRLSLAVLVRIETAVMLLLGVFVTLTQYRPDLLDITAIGTDPSNYYAAGLRLNAGHPLYALSPGDRPVPLMPPLFSVPLLSPPFLAVLWRPLVWLGDVSMILWWAAGLVCLVACTLWVISRASPRRNIVLLFLFPSIALAAISGNVNALLIAMCVGVAVAASRGRSTTAGILIALAAAIKLTPVLLIFWFIIKRDWRAVRAFLGTLMVVGLIQLGGSGLDNNLAYLSVMGDTNTIGATPISIVGLLKVFGAPVGLASAAPVVVTAIGIGLAWWFRQRPGVGFAILVIAVLLSSPVILMANFAILLAALWPIATRPRVVETAGPREPTALAAGQSAVASLADP